MFHTFKSAGAASLEPATSGSAPSGQRLVSIRACARCRRKKKKCDGQQPCESCVWCRKSASCYYVDSRRRRIPKKTTATSNETVDTAPDQRRVRNTASLPVQSNYSHRHAFRDAPRSFQTPEFQAMSPPSSATPRSTCSDAGILESLQPNPSDPSISPDSRDTHPNANQQLRPDNRVTHDVNALPLSVKHPTSYLGISMPPAVLRAIHWLYPQFKDVLAELQATKSYTLQDRRESIVPHLLLQGSSPRIEENSAWDEIPLINAYFAHLHPSHPLLDEGWFRQTYLSQNRQDARWKLLLNVVLALGSIAAGTAEDCGHMIYYERAKQHIGLEILSSVHWETVQALGLLGGVYLHYNYRPDEGIAVVGAAMRLALALGLHRDCTNRGGSKAAPQAQDANAELQGVNAPLTTEMRSRIWWSLFNIDTWGSTGLGRPSMGRMSQAVTARIPSEPIGGSHAMTKLFQDSVSYCTISTRIEDAMALSPIIADADRLELDRALIDWLDASTGQSLEEKQFVQLKPHRNLLRWRCYLSRVHLHRPFLLWYAMRRIPRTELESKQRNAIETCQKVAGELIADIASTWKAPYACHFAGANAAWILYQASMIPLLSLFSDNADRSITEECERQISIAEAALVELHCWSAIADHALESLSLIRDASYRYSAHRHNQTAGDAGDAQPHVTSSFQSPNGASGNYYDYFSGDGFNGLAAPSYQDFIELSLPLYLEDLSNK